MKPTRKNRQRGSAVMVGVSAVFIGMTTGLSIFALSTAGVTKASRARKQAQAFAISESGIELAKRWLIDQPSPPSALTPFDMPNAPTNLGGGTLQVQIVPDTTNGQRALKKYLIRTIGTVDGVSQGVDVHMKLRSFGRYAYFSDQESANPISNPIWFSGRDKIRGPVHTNNSNGSTTNIDNSNLASTIFESDVTMNGSTINYKNGDPVSDEDYEEIYEKGRGALKLSEQRVELPSTSQIQRTAAWGTTSGQPTIPGVYVPDAGGIYVVGNASVVLSAPSANTQVVTIGQGDTTTKITLNLLTNQTMVERGGTTTYRSSLGSGVLFVTGNITALSGTVADSRVSNGTVQTRSAMTIVADPENEKTITVAGSVRYRTAISPNADPSTGNNVVAGTLGIYANKVRVGTAAGNNVTIDGIIMAGSRNVADGGFGADEHDERDTGLLTLNGGLIQKVRGAVGTFRGNTQVSGFLKDYYYDSRLMDNPPPFFPTTGKYDQMYWKKN